MALLPEYDQFRVQNLDRKRKLAEALKQTQMPQGQMVGGVYVAPSITQYLASGLRQYQGNKQIRDIDQQQEQILGERQRTMTEASRKLAEALKPRSQESMVGGMPVMEERQPTPQELMQAQLEYAQMIQDPNAMTQAVGNQVNYQLGQQTRADEREFRSAESEANRQQRMLELQIRMEDSRLSREQQAEARRELAEMNNQARREIAAMTAANRPEKMVTILGPEGMPVMVPQSQAVGQTPYTPQLATQEKAKASSKAGKEQVNEIVNQLGSAYNTLKENQGITSTEGGLIDNLGAAAGTTAAGQFLGRIGGTENQKARDMIAQTRPLMLNAIKNATGMSAQQMNSNAEMQLYLNAATNPELGLEANMAALKNLDKLYGLGMFEGGAKPAASGGWSVKKKGN
jgi:hypothetical protein